MSEATIMKYYFGHDRHEQTEVSFYVEYDPSNFDEGNLDNEAYAMLQGVFPESWHSWKLIDKVDL